MVKANIILATHGKFGVELVKSAEMIVGKTENVYNLSLVPGESFEEFTQAAKDLLDSLSGPTFVFVDLFGGTPSNVMTALTRQYDHKVVTGVNLPAFIDLYLKTSMDSDADINNLASQVIKTIQDSAMYINNKLTEE